MWFRLTIILSLISTATAGTLQVAVGNIGCGTRQLTVQRLWKAMPHVRSVVIVPRKSGDLANRRVFIVSTDGAIPDQTALTRALGRRAERYPILSLAPALPVATVPSQMTASNPGNGDNEARRDGRKIQ